MPRGERAGTVAEEHQALRASARGIQAALAAGTCGCGCRAPRGCCRCLLDGLRPFADHLRQHFESEETSWRRDEDRLGSWTSRRLVEGLVGEHRDLAQRIEKVCAELEGADPGATPPDALACAIRGFLEDLLEHELSETRLFQRAILEDLGGGMD